MRELAAFEVDNVQGGFLPLLVAGAIAISMSGCATTGGVRRAERPVDLISSKRP